MFFYEPLYMAEQKQGDQLEPTYSSSVEIRDVALRTCQKRLTIGRGGETGSGISVLAARQDDDDDIYREKERMRERERERVRERESKLWLCLRFLSLDLQRFHLYSVALKSQKWITQRDARFIAVYIHWNTDSNGYR